MPESPCKSSHLPPHLNLRDLLVVGVCGVWRWVGGWVRVWEEEERGGEREWARGGKGFGSHPSFTVFIHVHLNIHVFIHVY